MHDTSFQFLHPLLDTPLCDLCCPLPLTQSMCSLTNGTALVPGAHLFNVGEFEFVCNCSDKAGNWATASAFFAVLDEQDPVLLVRTTSQNVAAKQLDDNVYRGFTYHTSANSTQCPVSLESTCTDNIMDSILVRWCRACLLPC